jgi:predicted dehydrogenase
VDVDTARPQVQTRSERWLQGTVLYNDGTLLVHNYSSEYFDKPFRAPRSLRVYGTSASIVDDTLLFGHDRVEKVQRELFAGRLAALVVETPLGPVCWKNPFASLAFSDEQIAVASLLQNMKLVVHSAGAPAYSAADALQDIEILEAMIRSSERGGVPIRMPLNATYHAFRSLPARAQDKLRRVAARRRPAS